MGKDLEYYLKLPYMIEVVPLSESEGGGYIARLPEIGRFAITGDGDTPEEAIKCLETAKRERFSEYLRKGIQIPEPKKEKEDYSGRFVVRLPRLLHRQLAEAAKENNTSLNQYVTYLLASQFHLTKKNKQFEIIMSELRSMRKDIEDIWAINYSFVPPSLEQFEVPEGEFIEEDVEVDTPAEELLRAA